MSIAEKNIGQNNHSFSEPTMKKISSMFSHIYLASITESISRSKTHIDILEELLAGIEIYLKSGLLKYKAWFKLFQQPKSRYSYTVFNVDNYEGEDKIAFVRGLEHKLREYIARDKGHLGDYLRFRK